MSSCDAHVLLLGLGVKYVSDQRAMSELIDGMAMLHSLYHRQLMYIYLCRTKEDENEISYEKEGHISELGPHEY